MTMAEPRFPPPPPPDDSDDGTTATAPRIRSVGTFADLKSVLPAYKELSFTDILMELSRQGISIDPQFYKTIQDSLLALERESGVPVSQIANTRYVFDAVQKAVEQGVSGGGCSGGGGGRAAAG